MVEYGGLEASQLDAEVEAQFVGQMTARPLDRPQGLGLAPGAVERRGQHQPPLLPERLALGERRGERHGVAVVAQRQPGLELTLLGEEPQLDETGGLGGRREPVGEHRVGPVTPQPERGPQRGLGAPGVAVREQGTGRPTPSSNAQASTSVRASTSR